MNTDLATQDSASMLERVVVGGDLSRLSSSDRLMYYRQVCESVGLNPLVRPFEYITLNGKLTLYAKRDATDQLRTLKGVSITKLERDKHSDLYVVTAYATDKEGRTDAATGAVSIGGLRGDALANAIMKAETKAKRRVTLSLCGLGLLDETETETIAGAKLGEPTTVSARTDADEAADLIPTESPEDDRAFFIERIGEISGKWTPGKRAVQFMKHFGAEHPNFQTMDIAALQTGYQALVA